MYISLIICGIVLIWYVSRQIRLRREVEEGNTEFDLATVNEKFSMAADTRQNLNHMEQLITDIDICNESAQKVLHLQWMGDDDAMHDYDLYLDGENTATECMREIAVRECFELRGALSYQLEILARETRRPSRKSVAKRSIFRNKKAGETDAETMCNVQQGTGNS